MTIPSMPPLPQLTQQQKTYTLIGAFLGVLLAALDQTIVATAGPTIQRDLQIEASLYTWLTTAYLVTSTMMVPIYGKLSDLYGRKPIILVGIVVFLFGSVLCGLANNAWFIIFARAVQGLGSAALFTSALAIISDMFPPAERGKYSGLFGAVFGLSSVVGPLVGGFLTDNFSWHWVFFVNLPVGAIALFFIITRMPNLRLAQHKPSIDFAGAFWLIVFSVPLLLALSLGKTTVRAGETGFLWQSPEILGMFTASVVGLLCFIFTETRAKDPLLDLKLFGNRVFSVGNAAAFVLGGAFLAGIVFLPIFVQNVVGLSATSSGFATLPLVIGLVIGNIFSGQLLARTGRYKPLMLASIVLLSIGFAVAGFTLTPQSSFWEVFAKMILLGFGLGPTIPLYTTAIQNAVSPMQIGVATSTATFFRQMGSTIGVAVLGSVFGNALSSELPKQIEAATKDAPAMVRERFSNQNGGSSIGEGSGNSLKFDASAIKAGAQKSIEKAFSEQESTLVAALQNNDAAAIQKLLANPQTPTPLRNALQNGGIAASVQQGFEAQYKAIAGIIQSGNVQAWQAFLQNPKLPAALKTQLSNIPAQAIANPQARGPILVRIKAGLDTAAKSASANATSAALEGAKKGLADAKATALAQTNSTIDKVESAFKTALTNAITLIYKWGVLIAILGFLVTAFLPEIPLRRTAGHGPPVAE